MKLEICIMKNKNKYCPVCCNKEFTTDILSKTSNRKTFKKNNRSHITYDRKYQKYKTIKKHTGPAEYTFYSILNVDFTMELGVAINMIARSILVLYNKLKKDPAKNTYIAAWHKSGENIIVLMGYNHKHLKYLKREAEFTALGTQPIYQQWYDNRVILALSVFGRKEDIEDIFQGLTYLR